MSIEPSATNDIGDHLVYLPFPNVHWGRVLYGLFITILPVVAFWGIQVDKPDWQSGRLRDYVQLLLLPEASLLFFPLLIYSIISYILLLISPSRYASSFLVRVGIYSGVFLALQYSVLALLVLELLPFTPLLIIAGMLSPLVFSQFYPWAIKNWGIKFIGVLFASVVLALYLIGALITRDLRLPLLLLVIFLAQVAPFWCFLLSARAALWLIKNFETKITLLRGFSFIGWLAAYIVAWRFDILKMYELYAALPTQPPNCYIATAAARGHSRFVRSRFVTLRGGKQMWVNPQLQRLKLGELALQATLPRLHKTLRGIYDVLGKALARRIQHPLLADIAYLLLKPFEWISIQVLSSLTPETEQMAGKIYMDQSK